MKFFKLVSFLLFFGICFSACGEDPDKEANTDSSMSTGIGNESTNTPITEDFVKSSVSCNIANYFSFANGNCTWNISTSFISTLTDVISANRVRYGIAYGTLASLDESFKEHSIYTESTIAIMKKMGVDAWGEKYESGNAGQHFTISTSSTKSGSKVSDEEIDLLREIKPYAVVAAFVEIDGKRFVINRNTQSINIR